MTSPFTIQMPENIFPMPTFFGHLTAVVADLDLYTLKSIQ